jgi:hypothetical protein
MLRIPLFDSVLLLRLPVASAPGKIIPNGRTKVIQLCVLKTVRTASQIARVHVDHTAKSGPAEKRLSCSHPEMDAEIFYGLRLPSLSAKPADLN